MLLENPEPDPVVTHGLEDEAFLRDKGADDQKRGAQHFPVQAAGWREDAVVYDVGAGTGSISIEAALQAEDGYVYAIEKKEEAVALMRENQKKFAVDNLEIVEGLAPEALESLPAPTHVFVGGSSGNMKTILELVLKKNSICKDRDQCHCPGDCGRISGLCKDTSGKRSRYRSGVHRQSQKRSGRYHMMMGQNPVYVISCTGGEAYMKHYPRVIAGSRSQR